ncbi:MAG: hypothetical protein RIQ81_1146 [Pseudomonadota bacterium]|jgi:tetratricopeptide (TPR) repeat protein
MNSRFLKTLIVVLAFGGAGGFYFWKRLNRRPHYVFINETANHRHDLALKMSLKIAEKRSGIENALILLRHLPAGKSIEETANSYFQSLQIGRRTRGRGLLFLYAEKENRFRIEVSYALEGDFPDAMCRRLEDAAQTYMLSEIPQDFLSELLITMNNGQDFDPELLGSKPAWLPAEFLSGGGGVSSRVATRGLDDYMRWIQKISEAGRSAFAPAADPSVVMGRYLDSLDAGIGDPDLPLLTAGSKVFRMVVPRTPGQQMRVHRYFSRALPFQMITAGDFATAVFRPGVPNLPVVLRKGSDGMWYVDEPKMWTWFHRFEDGDDFFAKYSDLTLLPQLLAAGVPKANRPVYKGRVTTPVPPAYPYDLEALHRDLEAAVARNPQDPSGHARLGEFYLFEVNWLTQAIASFEAAARLAPSDIKLRWRLYDLYMNHSEMEKALEQLSLLASALPRDAEVQEWKRFYTKAYIQE